METMTLTPTAVVATTSVRHAIPSYVIVPETFGALPTMAATAGHACTWSAMANGTVIRPAAKGLMAFGTRRLGEHST